MRSDKCGECGDEFVWDSDAGSAVCLACGTLQDPSQVVLDAHIEPEDNARERNTFPFYHRATLKNFRNAHGWDLAGQGKQAAAERNRITMREFTTTLACRIGHAPLASRAIFLFELAMERGHFRYGRKARLVAGASLALALRESQKGETIRDVAYLLNDTHVAVARVFTTIVSLLEVKLCSTDPSWHLPVLQRHLVSILTEGSSHLPLILVRALKNIHLSSAFRTATSLSELVSRAGLFTTLPSPPTACATYILALEGEALSPLPHCGDLAGALGRRFGASMEVVMRRYRNIYERIEVWASEIPWMEDVNISTSTKSAAKVPKRVGVARCLKDVVQFHESRWKIKLTAAEPLNVPVDGGKSVSLSEIGSVSEVDIQQSDEAQRSRSFRPRKRQKAERIDDVSRFLLSPLHVGASEKPYIDGITRLEAASHMLASDVPSFEQPPTRLQLLAAAKPVDDITDQELFAEGELDSFLRSTEEKEALIQTCEWVRDGESDKAEACMSRAQLGKSERGSTSRLNIEALSYLLNEHSSSDLVRAMDKDDDDDGDWGFSRQIMTQAEGLEDGQYETGLRADDNSHNTAPLAVGDNGEILGSWRPSSPGSE